MGPTSSLSLAIDEHQRLELRVPEYESSRMDAEVCIRPRPVGDAAGENDAALGVKLGLTARELTAALDLGDRGRFVAALQGSERLGELVDDD